MKAGIDGLRATTVALFLAAVSFGIVGCEEKSPLEEAGEALEEGIEDVGEELEDAAEEVEEAAEDAEEALRDR
jgi:hypothetical protein